MVFLLQLEKLITKNYFLNMSAKEAFKAYVRAYDSHHLKQIFDVDTLDLVQVGKSFGFTVPPAVDLSILLKMTKNDDIYIKKMVEITKNFNCRISHTKNWGKKTYPSFRISLFTLFFHHLLEINDYKVIYSFFSYPDYR